MAINANNLVEFVNNFNNAWVLVLQILLGLAYLWVKLGPSALAGLVVMFVMLPINALLTNKNRSIQLLKQKTQDERIKILNDVLNGIKVISWVQQLSYEESV